MTCEIFEVTLTLKVFNFLNKNPTLSSGVSLKTNTLRIFLFFKGFKYDSVASAILLLKNSSGISNSSLFHVNLVFVRDAKTSGM